MFKTKLIIGLLIAPFVTGCNTEIAFSSGAMGTYQNGKATLVIESGTGRFINNGMETIKPFRTEGEKIIFHMANSDKEHRGNIELIIRKDGDQLVCLSCGSLGVGTVWVKQQSEK